MEKEKELQLDYVELTDVVVEIAQKAVKEQEINTINYYTVDTKDIKDTVVINKKEDKYKISIDSFEWRIVKRSDIEALEVLLTVFNLLMKEVKKNNKQNNLTNRLLKQFNKREQINKQTLETN